MALKTRQGAFMAKQLKAHINGMYVGTARSGLGPAPGAQDFTAAVYGDVSGVQSRTYASGPVSVQVLEGPNSALLNIAMSEIRSKVPGDPILVRSGPSAGDLLLTVDVMDELMTSYGDGSDFVANWKATVSAPAGDPGGELVRTVEGPADCAMGILRGGHFLGRRVALTSTSGGWVGSWTLPTPVAIPRLDDELGVYLEIQKDTGYDRVVCQLEPDDTNVTASGLGGKITVTHEDVVDAGWLGVSGTDLHAYVMFVHDEATIQTHDYRYGSTI